MCSARARLTKTHPTWLTSDGILWSLQTPDASFQQLLLAFCSLNLAFASRSLAFSSSNFALSLPSALIVAYIPPFVELPLSFAVPSPPLLSKHSALVNTFAVGFGFG